MQYHPDRNPDDAGAEAKFKELNEAYSILSDDQKRAAYDRMGHAAFEGAKGGASAGFQDFGDIFSQIFWSQHIGRVSDIFGSTRGGRQRNVRGSDLRYEMEISLEEAFASKDLEIKIPLAKNAMAAAGTVRRQAPKYKLVQIAAATGKYVPNKGFSPWKALSQVWRSG